ncbi:hypothetical protein IEO21_09912 [Rhodonia placenta]|uniref:Uncharacterized protein n=1 Tax=Rhodonia placenta TaxID=104341 RepID=A0A8H7NTE4_9APHY|nr:hypothetical protein IEO21_09912 [Postia placenta]
MEKLAILADPYHYKVHIFCIHRGDELKAARLIDLTPKWHLGATLYNEVPRMSRNQFVQALSMAESEDLALSTPSDSNGETEQTGGDDRAQKSDDEYSVTRSCCSLAYTLRLQASENETDLRRNANDENVQRHRGYLRRDILKKDTRTNIKTKSRSMMTFESVSATIGCLRSKKIEMTKRSTFNRLEMQHPGNVTAEFSLRCVFRTASNRATMAFNIRPSGEALSAKEAWVALLGNVGIPEDVPSPFGRPGSVPRGTHGVLTCGGGVKAIVTKWLGGPEDPPTLGAKDGLIV